VIQGQEASYAIQRHSSHILLRFTFSNSIMKTILLGIFFFCALLTSEHAFSQSSSDSASANKNSTVYTSKSFTPQSFWNKPPYPDGFVNDYEHLFSKQEELSLDSLIRAYEKKTTRQIALLTLDSTTTTADSLDALTMRIANIWGVGQKDKNNGITISVSKCFRKMRIVNGHGIVPLLSDDETGELIASVFVPYFQAGKYYEGCYYGLATLMNTIDDHERRKK
jgi:uncharacterized protein